MMTLLLLLISVLGLQQERLIERAAFLHGCWARETGVRLVEEQWLAPRAGIMLGMSRTVRGDTLIEFEFLRIYEAADRLVFEAQPSGQARAEFRSVAVGADSLVFSNPTHDFPQAISYRIAGDSLFARIEGQRDGRQRAVDFRYRRRQC